MKVFDRPISDVSFPSEFRLRPLTSFFRNKLTLDKHPEERSEMRISKSPVQDADGHAARLAVQGVVLKMQHRIIKNKTSAYGTISKQYS